MSLLARIAALFVFVAFPSLLLGQTSAVNSVLSLSAGLSQFDLSGTGTAPAFALRLEQQVAAAWLLAEGGMTAMRPEEQGGARSLYVIPEAQLQAQVPTGTLRPYVGAGIGWFTQVTGPSPRTDEVSLAAALGARVVGAGRLGGRFELRMRGIGMGFEGSSAEWTAGLSWRLR